MKNLKEAADDEFAKTLRMFDLFVKTFTKVDDSKMKKMIKDSA